MKKNTIYIKRDKDLFHRKSQIIEDMLEDQFDSLVKQMNSALAQKEEGTEKIATQVTDIGTRAPLDPNIVDYQERIVFGGENRNIIRPIVPFTVVTGVVLTDATDLFTKAGHGLVNNDRVRLSSIVTTTGINAVTAYYVINVSGDDFQISTSQGGAAVVLTGNGSCSIQKVNIVIEITAAQPGDIIKSITEITNTIDAAITNFTLNDGASDLLTIDDIDTSITSASSPSKAMWIEYTTYKNLTLTIINATTFEGKIVIEILRAPQLYQQAVL